VHIALITTSYPFAELGSEAAGSFVKDFAKALSKHARVTVIAAGDVRQVTREGVVNVSRFLAPLLPLSLLDVKRPAHWRHIFITLRNGNEAVRELIITDKPDHILALWVLPSGYWARAAFRNYGVPYSTWALGSDIWALGRIPFLRHLIKNIVRSASISFADGYKLGRDVEKISRRGCIFLPSTRTLPVLRDKKLATSPPYRLAFLGRWHPNKGADLLMAALNRLSTEDWSKITEIRIAGGGPLEEEVLRQTGILQAAGRPVQALGYLGEIEAKGLLEWADYLLIPSRIESIPVVFSDALSCLCPIIATPVGDIPEIARSYNVGILASGVSSSGIADAIREALSKSPGMFRTNIEKCQTMFNQEAIAKQLFNRLSD